VEKRTKPHNGGGKRGQRDKRVNIDLEAMRWYQRNRKKSKGKKENALRKNRSPFLLRPASNKRGQEAEGIVEGKKGQGSAPRILNEGGVKLARNEKNSFLDAYYSPLVGDL